MTLSSSSSRVKSTLEKFVASPFFSLSRLSRPLTETRLPRRGGDPRVGAAQHFVGEFIIHIYTSVCAGGGTYFAFRVRANIPVFLHYFRPARRLFSKSVERKESCTATANEIFRMLRAAV